MRNGIGLIIKEILGRGNSVDPGDRSRVWQRGVFLARWRLERTYVRFRIYEISTKETGGRFERQACLRGNFLEEAQFDGALFWMGSILEVALFWMGSILEVALFWMGSILEVALFWRSLLEQCFHKVFASTLRNPGLGKSRGFGSSLPGEQWHITAFAWEFSIG